MPQIGPSGAPTGAEGAFPATRWSVVLQAAGRASPESAEALEALCRAYWRPLYAFVRREGYAPAEAQDLTQEFFSRLLEKHWLDDVRPGKGRFRSFLLAAVKHLLANEWKRAHRQKRGGGAAFVSLDETETEERGQLELAGGLTPDRAFERRWVETLLGRVLGRLRGEFEAAGYADRYALLKPFLLNHDDPRPCEEFATRLGLTVSGAKSAIRRMRLRYAELFRDEIAQTVGGPEEVEDEIRHLLAVMSD